MTKMIEISTISLFTPYLRTCDVKIYSQTYRISNVSRNFEIILKKLPVIENYKTPRWCNFMKWGLAIKLAVY